MPDAARGWEVEFFDLGDGETALDELASELPRTGLAQLARQIARLVQHGRGLPAQYFGKIKGSKAKLWELRLTVQSGDVRFLYVQVEHTFYILKGFRHRHRDDALQHIATAEARLKEWGIQP
jgi:phage-related protein